MKVFSVAQREYRISWRFIIAKTATCMSVGLRLTVLAALAYVAVYSLFLNDDDDYRPQMITSGQPTPNMEESNDVIMRSDEATSGDSNSTEERTDSENSTGTPSYLTDKESLYDFIDHNLDPVFKTRKHGTYINLLNAAPPKFLPHYRNPCWVEQLDTAYPYNGTIYYNDQVRCKGYFTKMEKIWANRLKHGLPWRLRCLPYFYLAGMPKCGTTDLYDKLALHPMVTTGQMKEAHFWTRQRVTWSKIPIGLYIDLFDEASERIRVTLEQRDETFYHPMVFGDGSVTTLYENDWWRDLPENKGAEDKPKYVVADYLKHIQPNARFVVILRDPVERLYSDHMFFGKNEKSPDVFNKAVHESLKIWKNCLQSNSLWQCVTDRMVYRNMGVHVREGIYHFYLKEWMKMFPKQNFYILLLEEYSNDRVKYLNEIYKFLGLDPLPADVERSLAALAATNARSEAKHQLGDMDEETRQRLQEFYRPHNRELAKFLNNSKYLWGY